SSSACVMLGVFKPGWQRFMVAWCPYQFLPRFPEPLLASMDLVHESTTPEAALRPFTVCPLLDCIGMVRPIPIGFQTRLWRCASRWFWRFVGCDHKSRWPVRFVREHRE